MDRARQGLAAPYALVTGYAALLAVGTVAAALHGRFSATGVLIASAAVVTAWSFAAEPLAVIPLGVVGWLTAVGFAHPPYAQLRLTGPHAANAAIVIGRVRAGRSRPRPAHALAGKQAHTGKRGRRWRRRAARPGSRAGR